MKIYPLRTLSLSLELFQCATTLKQCVSARNIACMYTHCTSVGTRITLCVYTLPGKQTVNNIVPPLFFNLGTKREQTGNRNKTRTRVTPRGVRRSYMFNTSILGGILKIYHVHH